MVGRPPAPAAHTAAAIRPPALANVPTSNQKGTAMNNRQIGLGIIIAIVGALALTIAFGSFYTIDQTQRGVLLRNGAFVEVVQPGLHFKWPWIDAVAKIDMQTHTFTWSKMESYSADQQPANLKVSVTL